MILAPAPLHTFAERDRRGVPASAWARLGGARKGLNKNLENNPMQSRVAPARSFSSEETGPQSLARVA